jgi:hypothetical protein
MNSNTRWGAQSHQETVSEREEEIGWQFWENFNIHIGSFNYMQYLSKEGNNYYEETNRICQI